MNRFFAPLRRRRAEHRSVFAEFAFLLIFAFAEQVAARKSRARLRVVR